MKSLLAPFILALALTLTGCASPTTRSQAAPAPAEAMVRCPDLAPLQSATGKAILDKLVEVSEMYYDCQAKHDALVKYADH